MDASLIEGMVGQSDCGCEVSVGEGEDRVVHFMVDGELKPLELDGAKLPFSARIAARKPLN